MRLREFFSLILGREETPNGGLDKNNTETFTDLFLESRARNIANSKRKTFLNIPFDTSPRHKRKKNLEEKNAKYSPHGLVSLGSLLDRARESKLM